MFLKALQNLEEHQHQIFLNDLEKTLKYFENKEKLQQIEQLNILRKKDNDR